MSVPDRKLMEALQPKHEEGKLLGAHDQEVLSPQRDGFVDFSPGPRPSQSYMLMDLCKKNTANRASRSD